MQILKQQTAELRDYMENTNSVLQNVFTKGIIKKKTTNKNNWSPEGIGTAMA